MNLDLMTSRLRGDYPVVLEPVVHPHPQTSAVLVLLFQKHQRPHVLLIRRSANLRSHPGEISFPGGVYQAEDENLLHTALRETQEEVGLELEPDQIVSRLPTVTTLTEFVVSPFAARLDELPPLVPNAREVAEILQVPVAPLLTTLAPDVGYRRDMDMWVLHHGPHRIWGATARILRYLELLA